MIKVSEIFIGENIAERFVSEADCFIIADERVAALYPDMISTKTYFVPVIDGAILFSIIEEIIHWLTSYGCRKGDHIIAIGGGAVIDLAGFIASIYMQGVSWTAVPTTLVSMVSSAIGGHVGLTYNKLYKAVSVHFPPESIVIDPIFLNTLPTDEILSGIGEGIRLAFIGDIKLYNLLTSPAKLLKRDKDTLMEFIRLGVNAKQEILRGDPLGRAFYAGHTIGYIIELLTGIPYGQATAIGLYHESVLGAAFGLVDGETIDELYAMLAIYGLAIFNDFSDTKTIAKALSNDVKRRGDDIVIPFVKNVGFTDIKSVKIEDVLRFLI